VATRGDGRRVCGPGAADRGALRPPAYPKRVGAWRCDLLGNYVRGRLLFANLIAGKI
jgi:hypothetical protein